MVHQAKTQLSKLLQQVGGEGSMRIKIMRDQIIIGDDFDLPLDGLFDGRLEPSGC